MDLYGEIAGRIGVEGGGSDIKDVKTKTTPSGSYNSVVNSEDKTAYIDLSSYATKSELSDYATKSELSDYATKSELSDYVTSEALETTLEDYTTYQYTESRYTPLATFNAYTISAESHFQHTLTAGENITIDPVTNTISASGGGGGGLDLPTDGTPVAIGTFGNQTIYMQYFVQSLVGTSSGTRNVWQGQNGDMVISCNCVAYPNDNPPTKAVVPYSRTSNAHFSWIDNEYEALPTIAINYSLESNLWSRNSATLKGCVIFIR